jgi:flavin reductase (DIM6/NTAB) family NADH-FMN oxidoreductase RutF
VVHLAAPGQLAAVHQSGGEYPAEVSEVAVLGLATVPSLAVRPPRLRDAPVAYECRLVQEIPVGSPPTALCLLEVLHLHVADRVLAADGFPDPAHLRTPARLGNRSYLDGSAWPVVELPAPVI